MPGGELRTIERRGEAAKENPGYHYAAVWMLDPWELNKRIVRQDEVAPPGDPGINRADRSRYENGSRNDSKSEKGGRAGHPPFILVTFFGGFRPSARASRPTIHGSDKRGLG